MSQFAREDSQAAIDLISDGDVVLESDRNQDGVGDLVFRTAGVERARIKHDGTGTGWSNVLGGYMPAVTSSLGSLYYDRRRNIYGMRPDRYRRTRAKIAAAYAGSGVCRIACVGDSTTEGRQSSGRSIGSYPVRLRKLLSGLGYPIAGDGMILPGKAGVQTDERWTTSTNWTFSLNTPQNGEYIAPSNTTSPLICTPTTAFTAFDIYANDTANFQYSTDGGSTWTTVAAGVLGSTITKKVSLTGLTGVTTVQIKQIASTNIFGIDFYGASGITVSNFGCSGLKSSDWIDTTTSFYDLINVLIKFAPDVVLYDIGINDGTASVSAATFQANLATFLGLLPATTDVFLVVPTPINAASSGTYEQSFYTVADAHSLAVLDLFDRWGSYSTANTLGMMNADGTHPDDEGYVDIAYAALGLLVP